MRLPTTPIRTLVPILASLTLSACGTMMPDYLRPAAPVPAALTQPAELASAAEAADTAALDATPWQDYFADARLREVIALALTNNRDLRVAAPNIERARAQYGIQRADLFPAIVAGGGQSAQRLPGDLNSSGDAAISRQYSANLGFAGYELDFIGADGRRLRIQNDLAFLHDVARHSFGHKNEGNRAIQTIGLQQMKAQVRGKNRFSRVALHGISGSQLSCLH